MTHSVEKAAVFGQKFPRYAFPDVLAHFRGSRRLGAILDDMAGEAARVASHQLLQKSHSPAQIVRGLCMHACVRACFVRACVRAFVCVPACVCASVCAPVYVWLGMRRRGDQPIHYGVPAVHEHGTVLRVDAQARRRWRQLYNVPYRHADTRTQQPLLQLKTS